MLFWALIGGMTAAALLMLLRPLLRPAPPPVAAAPDLAIGLPLAALALYAGVGAPDLVRPGALAPATEAPPDGAEIAAMVERLAARLAQDPSDAEGWRMLGRSYGVLGRYGEAANAYAQAIAHGAEGADVQSAYGEALTAAADGQVTEPARAAFEAALRADPKNPRARFYLALARAQTGKLDEALAMWVALEADAPAGAGWREAVSAQIERTARALGRDPETLPGRAARAKPGPAAGPDAQDRQAAAAMSPAEREAYIRGMVDRLAARLQEAPDDLEGWLRLARSYEVLGEQAKALDAWRRAAALAPSRADVLLGYAAAQLGGWAGEDHPLPDGFGKTVAQARALDPANPLGLYFAGLVAAEAGDAKTARSLWTALLPQLPEGSAERADLERRIAALDARS